MSKSRSKRKTEEENVQRFVAQSELHRTIRFVVLCELIGFCFWVVCRTIAQILDKPPWLAFLLALIAPSGLLFAVLRSIRRYTRKNLSRTKRLEEMCDPDRSSSGLLEDGTNPPEDRL